MDSIQRADGICFDFHDKTPVAVQFKDQRTTGDAGLLVVGQFEKQWGYLRRFAALLDDRRDGPMHTMEEMIAQRVYGILAGYEDCNDHDSLRGDGLFKLVAGRLPEDDDLASQPTLSRMENSVAPKALMNLVDLSIATGLERLEHVHGVEGPGELILDMDATDDPAHGHQQLTLFHGYYGQYQYYPLIISEPITKHVFLAWLRFGTAHAALGADDDLERVATAIRRRFPEVRIHVRGDGAYGHPKMMDLCERLSLSYTFGLATNNILKRESDDLLAKAQRDFEATRIKQRLFEVFDYQAESWPYARRVVVKAECHVEGINRRFVVTNVPTPDAAAAKARYDEYAQRGESEHRMDELKNGLGGGRLSCHRFMANFLRLQIHVCAMNLLSALRRVPGIPERLTKARPELWRMEVLKAAATIRQSVRRTVVEISAHWPFAQTLRAVSEAASRWRVGGVAADPAGP